MTYAVTENCIICRYFDCGEVCPVDCFCEGANVLAIHLDECIDYGVCEPECPADATRRDTERDVEKGLALNAEFAAKWSKIAYKREPASDAAEWDGKPGKLAFFNPELGQGG